MQVTVRKRTACTESECDAFVAFVAQGGEVPVDYIRSGIDRAEALLWLERDEKLIAVAALKNPLASYRESTFKKAKLSVSEGFPLELGYIYVTPEERGKGHAIALVREALELAPSTGIFATTRADNEGMQVILAKAGFVHAGSDYSSNEDKRRLLRLHLRESPKSLK